MESFVSIWIHNLYNLHFFRNLSHIKPYFFFQFFFLKVVTANNVIKAFFRVNNTNSIFTKFVNCKNFKSEIKIVEKLLCAQFLQCTVNTIICQVKFYCSNCCIPEGLGRQTGCKVTQVKIVWEGFRFNNSARTYRDRQWELDGTPFVVYSFLIIFNIPNLVSLTPAVYNCEQLASA